MIGTGKQNLLTIPSVGVALLPKLARPTCWPVYASILTYAFWQTPRRINLAGT